jgi:hypothetical protein
MYNILNPFSHHQGYSWTYLHRTKPVHLSLREYNATIGHKWTHNALNHKYKVAAQTGIHLNLYYELAYSLTSII